MSRPVSPRLLSFGRLCKIYNSSFEGSGDSGPSVQQAIKMFFSIVGLSRVIFSMRETQRVNVPRLFLFFPEDKEWEWIQQWVDLSALGPFKDTHYFHLFYLFMHVHTVCMGVKDWYMMKVACCNSSCTFLQYVGTLRCDMWWLQQKVFFSYPLLSRASLLCLYHAHVPSFPCLAWLCFAFGERGQLRKGAFARLLRNKTLPKRREGGKKSIFRRF